MNMMGGGSGKMGAAKGMKPGDWMCPSCGDHQFAKNLQCRQCFTANPSGGASPGKGQHVPGTGDWNCPSCGDFQFKKNEECRSCGTTRPEGAQAKLPGDWTCPSC